MSVHRWASQHLRSSKLSNLKFTTLFWSLMYLIWIGFFFFRKILFSISSPLFLSYFECRLCSLFIYSASRLNLSIYRYVINSIGFHLIIVGVNPIWIRRLSELNLIFFCIIVGIKGSRFIYLFLFLFRSASSDVFFPW